MGSVKGDGAGQTIAIVDAYDNPNIASDLAAFSKYYGLAAANLVKVNQKGSTSSLPTKNSDWGLETALDVEWAHAIAPAAKIVLVEASSSSLSDLLTAVKYASSVASVVSCSWGTDEFSSETQYDSYFSTSGVTYVVSSGDTGGTTSWPAVSPKVVSVGGTTLTITATANGTTTTYSYSSETSWSGSGGGYSQYESEPSWQYTVQSTGRRTTPDVSYDANSSTGFRVYDTYGYSGWVTVGGTSAGAPQWAGIFAIVNQGRAAKGLTSLSNAASDLYALDTTSTYSTDYYDITSGSAGRYKASSGYDLVTGLGSPKAAALTSALIASADTVSSSSGSGSSGGSGSGGSRAPGWGPFGPRRFAELAGETGAVVLVSSSDADYRQDIVSNATDPEQSLSMGIARIGGASPTSIDSFASALADAIVGRQHNGETTLPYQSALSFTLPTDSNSDSGGVHNRIAVTTGASAGRPSAVNVSLGADSAMQAARVDARSDSAAFSSDSHRQAIDACLAEISLDSSHAKADDAPMLPGPEKSDVTLRAEALAAVALTLARVQLKNKTEPDEARRWRWLHQID